MSFRRFFAHARVGLVCSVFCSIFALAACSSSGDGGNATSANGTSPSSCTQAKTVSDECNAQPADGGAKLTVKFDEAKCESAGDQGKKVADCIVQNKDRCECIVACSLQGSCP